MGHCEWFFGQYDQALRTLSRAAEVLEACKNAEEAGYAYMLMVWNNLCLSNYDQVFFFKELALRMLEQQFHLRWYVWVFGPCALAYTHKGQWDSALKEAHRALSVSEEHADDSMISFANWTTSMVYTNKGDSKRAIEHGELAVRKAPTLMDKVLSQIFLGWALCRGGELRRGLEILTMVTPILRGSGFEMPAITSELVLCEAYWLAGEYEKSKVALEELDQRTQRNGMRFWRGSGQRLLGEVALKTDPSNAAVHFENSIAILREVQAENELALAYAGYGRMHRQQGDIRQAREYLTQALEIFERLGTLIEPEKVRRELTELPDKG
jgi:tetratricopeptide (TPR) repeat protein